MALTFLSGSAPDYSGYIFTSTSDLINTIESTLQTAGWATVEKAADGLTLLVKGVTSVGSHECFIEFSIYPNASVTNGYYISLRGFHDALRSNGSPANTLRWSFIDGTPNRLWITADNDSGAISILNSSNGQGGAHFGFLHRIDTTDPWAWMVGYIHSLGYQYAYVAKAKYNSVNWRLLSDDYNQYTNLADGSYPVLPYSTFDFLQRGGWVNSHYYYATGSKIVFYNKAYGRLNYTGTPIIDPYFYHEGRGSTTNYNPGSYLPSYFRGYVKHAYCGVASLATAAQVVDNQGNRILSVGTTYWQGMRIL
jgi:hypothetical protein